MVVLLTWGRLGQQEPSEEEEREEREEEELPLLARLLSMAATGLRHTRCLRLPSPAAWFQAAMAQQAQAHRRTLVYPAAAEQEAPSGPEVTAGHLDRTAPVEAAAGRRSTTAVRLALVRTAAADSYSFLLGTDRCQDRCARLPILALRCALRSTRVLRRCGNASPR